VVVVAVEVPVVGVALGAGEVPVAVGAPVDGEDRAVAARGAPAVVARGVLAAAATSRSGDIMQSLDSSPPWVYLVQLEFCLACNLETGLAI